MTKILLETINLKKTYDHKNGIINLFENVNIKIKYGDLIALVGPSGSGKSSLLHLLALLDNPNKGKILFKDSLKGKYDRYGTCVVSLISEITGNENHQLTQEEKQQISEVFSGLAWNLSK